MDLQLVLLKIMKLDGAIYISSFACGIDSVVLELIKEKIWRFSSFSFEKLMNILVKAVLDTRIEAFIDMIERRKNNENNISTSRQHISCS